MTDTHADVHAIEDPEGRLEQELIEEFLHARGYDPPALAALPEDERLRLLKEASIHAAGKLAEVEARAHFVERLHQKE